MNGGNVKGRWKESKSAACCDECLASPGSNQSVTRPEASQVMEGRAHLTIMFSEHMENLTFNSKKQTK